MSSVICQFGVWLNSPATLMSGQPFWIGHFPQALRGNTEKTAPLNGTFNIPLASQNIRDKMRGENIQDAPRSPEQKVAYSSWSFQVFLKKKLSSISPTPTCSPPHLSSTPAVQNYRWIIYLASLFCMSLSGFNRFLEQIWRWEIRCGPCLNKGLKQSQLQPDQIFTFKRSVIPDWKQACCSSCGNYYRFTYAYHFPLSTSFFVFHALSKSCTWIGLKLY